MTSKANPMSWVFKDVTNSVESVLSMQAFFCPENVKKLSNEERLEIIESRLVNLEKSLMFSQVMMLRHESLCSDEVLEGLLERIVGQME